MKRLLLFLLLPLLLLQGCRSDKTALYKSERRYLNSQYGCVHNDWQFHYNGKWYDATVHGNIHDDLLANE